MVALFPYTAQNDDELSFLQGDVVHVIDREDPAWWKGELRGQVLLKLFDAWYLWRACVDNSFLLNV